MDEIELSKVVIESGTIPALCFSSALPKEPVKSRSDTFPVEEVLSAIDNSSKDFILLRTEGDVSPRMFYYGIHGNRITLAETCLVSSAIISNFVKKDMRKAPWRKAASVTA